MIRSAVTISLVPEARSGPFVFHGDLAEGCRKAADLGYDAIEVFPPAPEAVRTDELPGLLDRHELKLAAVGTGAGWVKHRLRLTDPDAGVRGQALQFVRGIIDAAGTLGAPTIIGSMQGRWGDGVDRDAAVGYLSDALNDLGDHAARYVVPLIYEPLNRYETNMANTLDEGVRLLAGLATRNVTLLADLFHMNIEEVDVAAALRAAGRHVGHVHFVDTNRRPAGSGHMDFAPIVAALREIGYNGYASAEALPHPDPDTAARMTIEAFRKYFGTGG